MKTYELKDGVVYYVGDDILGQPQCLASEYVGDDQFKKDYVRIKGRK